MQQTNPDLRSAPPPKDAGPPPFFPCTQPPPMGSPRIPAFGPIRSTAFQCFKSTESNDSLQGEVSGGSENWKVKRVGLKSNPRGEALTENHWAKKHGRSACTGGSTIINWCQNRGVTVKSPFGVKLQEKNDRLENQTVRIRLDPVCSICHIKQFSRQEFRVSNQLANKYFQAFRLEQTLGFRSLGCKRMRKRWIRRSHIQMA